MAPLFQSLSVPSSLILVAAALFLLGASPTHAFQGAATTSSHLKVIGGKGHPDAAAQLSRTLRTWLPTTTSSINQASSNHRLPRTILNMGASSSSISSTTLPDATKSEFQNKSILLTGASRGLGKSLAHALSTCQPSLLILSGRDEAALKEVKQECLQIIAKEQQQQQQQSASAEGTTSSTTTTTTNVEIVVCDLANKSSVETLASQSLQLASSQQQQSSSKTIDVLINNGGISSRSSFLQTKLDVDERLMQVNFFSGAALAKSVVPGMVEMGSGGGKIVWISSVQGKLGTPYRTSYAASKFAVQGYCEALRSELASSNVSVHIVSPGYIRTNLSMSAVMGDGKAYSKMDSTTENGADPEEVAAQILNSVANGEMDFVVAATFSARAAMWLKFVAPSFLENMLVKRFEKQKIESSDKKKDD